VKGCQVAEVAPRPGPLLSAGGYAVPLENGVEAAAHLAAVLGEERVAGGICFMLSRLEGPGRVKHVGESLRVTVGERRGPPASARLEALCGVLRAASVDAGIAQDIEAASWEKFLFIEPFGSVGAVTRAPAGVFRALRETRALLVAAMEEIAQLGRARNVRLGPEAVGRALAAIDAMPADATASMQRDVQSGRPSELFDQTGAVVRLARDAALPVPVHAFLWAALLPQEQAARQPGGR
jgi:2-dehydropantoate 2-reductase